MSHRARAKVYVGIGSVGLVLSTFIMGTGLSGAQAFYDKYAAAGADLVGKTTFTGVQQTRYDSIPSGMGTGTILQCETMFSSTSPVVYQSQEIILQNGYIIEMGTGHQCADSNYPNGFEYWYAGYYDGNASWHNEFHHTISGSAQHTFYIFETTSTNCGDSHCWQIQIDSTHEGVFGVVQTGTSPLVWIAPTSSSSSIHSSYQVSQMAYTDSYGGWNNFSGTGFNAGGTTLCVYNYSDTKMNVADNPSDWTNCT